MEVPADGNCLVWSMRYLLLGPDHVKKCRKTEADNEQKQLRDQLGNLWEDVKTDQLWQMLFAIFCPEHARGSSAPDVKNEILITPTKKRKAFAPGEPIDLLTPEQTKQGAEFTPPRPTHPAKRKGLRVEQIGDAKPVPFAQKEAPTTPTLSRPAPKSDSSKPVSLGTFLEQTCPDLQDLFHKVHMQIPNAANPDSHVHQQVDDFANPEKIDASMFEDEKDVSNKRKRVEHERRFKSRVKTAAEVRQERMNVWFASQQLTYHAWLTSHRKACRVQKASICPAGTWSLFKDNIAKGVTPKCQVCTVLLSSHGVTSAKLEEHISGETQAAQAREEKSNGEEGLPDTGQKTDGDDGEELSEYEKCVQYVTKFSDMIDLIEDDGKLKYKCKICITRNQSEGKVNKLGSKPVLKTVKYYLQQHFNCATHVAKLKELEERQKDTNTGPTVTKTCPGYCVSDPSSPGHLSTYIEEFKLYLNHSCLTNRATKHKYWCDMTSDQWFVRHSMCPSEFEIPVEDVQEDAPTICPKCTSLGDSRALVRGCIRFATKYHAAILLRNRLFGSEEDLKESLAAVEASTFFLRQKKCWEDIVALPNIELQKFVRQCWTHVVAEEQTKSTHTFLMSVVEPCLKVHGSAVHSNVAALSDQFLNAMTSNNQSDT